MKSVMTKVQVEREVRELERFGKRVFPCSPPLNVHFDLNVLRSKRDK